MASVQEFIDSEYRKVFDDNSSFGSKQSSLFTIIELKQNYPALSNLKRDVYVDIKQYLAVSFSQDACRNYGYDTISVDKVKSVIEGSSLTDAKRYALFEYALTLASPVFVDVEELKNSRDLYYGKVVKKKNKIQYLLLISSQSIRSILLTLFVLFLIELVVLFPAPFPCMELFDFSTSDICDNYFLNHVANVVSLHIGVTDISSVIPTNAFATVLLFLWEIILVVFAANILFSKLLSKIHLNESR